MAVTSIFDDAEIERPELVSPEVSEPQREPVTGVTSIFDDERDYVPAVDKTFLTNEQILKDPLQLKTARDYMVVRQGDYYKTASDEDVLDDFVDHMRWRDTNEAVTIGEAISVYGLEEREKKTYADAYKLYDKLGTAYQAGGVGELADAAAHYTGAILSSPSTFVGGFLGRALSKPVTRGITKLAGGQIEKKVVTEAAKAVTKATPKVVAEKAVSTAVKKESIKKAAKAVEAQVVKKSGLVAAKKSRNELVTAAVIATSFDGSIAAVQDKMNQQSRVNVGAQDEIDWSSVAMAATFGIAGGGFAYFPEAMRGTVKMANTGEKIALSNKLRSIKAKTEVAKDMEISIKKLVTDWDSVAAHGQEKDASKFLRDKAVGWFFDWEDEKSFVRILHKAGADLGTEDKNFSHKVIEYARGLPPQNRSAITKALKPLGINFGELIEIFAGALKEGGENLSKASQASRIFQDFKNTSLAKNQAIQKTLDAEDELAKNLKDTKVTNKTPPPEAVRYLASVWKRLIISHPSTTMVNVKGWGLATAARSFSEILHGGVLGSVGLAQKLAGSTAADKTLAKSSAMFKSNLLLARSLLDPFTSVQGFTDLLESAPSRHKKESLGAFFGGVGDERPEMFNINPKNRLVNATEKAIDAAARVAFVRTQDVYTKSLTGLKELDKLSRMELGVGVEELIAKGQTHLITDDMWDKTVRVLLEDTFSVNYTRGHSNFNQMAKVVEQVSNAPYFGFVFPFGRFINNTVGFTFQYSPLAFLPLVKFQKGIDLEERLVKATVGTTAMVMAYQREKDKQEQGLQWYEERSSTGEVKNVSRLFPLSLYNLMGRFAVDVENGSGVPMSLFDELVKQIGPLGMLKDATSSNPVTEMVTMMTKASEKDGGATLVEFSKQIASMAFGAVAGVAAGYTRPLDPYNDLIGMGGNFDGTISDAIPNRKLAGGMDAALMSFTRYTNNFFSMILGEDKGDGKMFGSPKRTATEAGVVRDPNPIASLFGETIQPRQDSLDILLGMTDHAPFKMDSLTTGVPEYDNFINGTIFPILERKSEALLSSDFFKSRPLHIKRRMVTKMLETSRDEITEGLENGSIGEFEDYLFNERKNFMSLDQAYRAEAKRALGIDVEDRKLTLDDISKLRLWIDVVKDLDEEFVKRQ